MQYSVVNYKTVREKDDFRWDGEFLCFEPRKNSQYEYAQIGDVLKFAQYGISIDMNEEGQGYKIYRMNEISNMFCDLEIDKYADIEDKEMKKFVLKNDDVLFNRTNSQAFVGRTGIFKKFSDESLIFASYLVRFRPNTEKILPEYLTAFLNTKYGIQDVKRRARISINQSNVSSSELQKVEIPILSINFQSKLKPLFNKAFQLILDSKSLYSKAEQLLLSELGLLDWRSKHELAFVKNFSDTQRAERFDAEYFQPKYGGIIEAVKKYKGGSDTIRGQFKQNKKSFKKILDKEYQYIEISCVNTTDGSMEPMKLQGPELPANAKIKFQKNDVIVSKVRPYRGAIGIVDSDDCIGSGAFTVLQENGVVNKETLMVFLRLKPLLDFSLKFNTGTSYPTITDEDILNFPLPKIDSKTQEEIRKKITEMYETKKLSKSLLEIAKRGVEMAIEKSEKEAEKWINSEASKLKIKL